MKKILMFCLLSAVTSHVFAVPTITKSVSAGTTFKFTETLSEKLPTGYKVKIDLNNGKGLVAMTCSGTTCTLSSNALPKVDTSIYKVGIYDAKGVLQGATTNGNYVIVSTAVTVTTAYTKISNSGVVLPDSATLGSGVNDWACTKDNKTGLTWEVKTKDGGFRDKDLTYSNYFQNGISPVQDKNNYGLSGNSDVFVKDVNKQSLCGSADWRLPTKNEMDTLIYCSENACKYAYVTINTVYFPNTHGSEYWTSTTSQGYFTIPFFVYFGSDGYSGGGDMASKYYIRLVR